MPLYTPTTPTLTLCDDLVDSLTASWAPAAPDGVERAYFKRFADTEDERLKITGRRVVIFPTDYGSDPFTRGEDLYTHNISVLTVERYEGQGDPPRDWTDRRVDFVYEQIFNGFSWDFRTGNIPTFNRNLAVVTAEVQVCDLEKLVSGGRLFYSLVAITFNELIDA